MDFPLLDTAVTVQYSAAKIRDTRHDAHRFLGDARQTHRNTISSGQRWLLRYESLNGTEANRLRAFYESIAPNENFYFLDPWSGQTAQSCRLSELPFSCETTEPGTYRVQLEVEDAS